jgi:hypothetical protein
MNRAEAKAVLGSQVRELKKHSYSEFRSWIVERRIETPLVKGTSGTEYQVEAEALWDSEPSGDIRVLVSVDDGGLLSSFLPLADSFLISPDGSLPHFVVSE